MVKDQEIRCSNKACFANGCGGTCRLESMYENNPKLVDSLKSSEYTCRKPIEIVKISAKEGVGI